MERDPAIKKGDTPETNAGESIMAMVLKSIHDNVVAGVRDAQRAGIRCGMPTTIEVDIALDADGLPCVMKYPLSVESARIKTTIQVCP